MRYKEFKIAEAKLDEVPDDGSRAGQEPNAPVDESGIESGPPYPPEDMEAVRTMQSKLQELGYSVGSTGVDGKYGPRTTRAVGAYKQDHNVDGAPNAMSQQQLDALQSAEPVENPTPTGNEVTSNNVSSTGGAATGGQPGSLEGTSVLAANNNPDALPNQNIIDALDAAASSLGIQVQITPNGGRASRDGTNNHPPGQAADIQIVQNGNLITPGSNSQLYDDLISTLVRNAAARGVRPGIGGYSWGIHYDESTWRQGRSDSIAGTWNNGYDVSSGVAGATATA